MAETTEQGIGEEAVIVDVAVRFVERLADGWCFAIGAPVTDEWCYLADSASLVELEAAARVVLEDAASRGIFVRMAALLGVAWPEGGMLPLLDEQQRSARRLMERAPDTAEADPEELRRLRDDA
jgi:hypothetical protein